MSIREKLAAFEPERLEQQKRARRSWRLAIVSWLCYAAASFFLAWVLARR